MDMVVDERVKVLQSERRLNIGCQFRRINGTTIRYRMGDIAAFLESRGSLDLTRREWWPELGKRLGDSDSRRGWNYCRWRERYWHSSFLSLSVLVS